MRNIRHPLTDKSGLWKICGLIIPYQMYSAMIRSVKGLVSRLRRLSTLLIVLLSDWRAITLKLLTLLLLLCFFCFNTTEFHNFDDAMELGLVNLIWHVGEAAKICVILIPVQNQKVVSKPKSRFHNFIQ